MRDDSSKGKGKRLCRQTEQCADAWRQKGAHMVAAERARGGTTASDWRGGRGAEGPEPTDALCYGRLLFFSRL